MIKIAPSILAADPLNLERDIRKVTDAGCDWLHVDVMDAHFVPNLAYTPAVVRRLKEIVNIPVDVHLMMDHPETLLDAFLKAGADVLTIHAECDGNVPDLLEKIRRAGVHPGIAIRPATPLEKILPWTEDCDLILTMTVEPGFGGQTLDESVPEKIRALRKMGYRGWIEADGGIKEDNLPYLIECGLGVAVMGTAIFGTSDTAGMMTRLHDLARKGRGT